MLPSHRFTQGGGGDDFHVAAMAQDVHQQFGFLAVGHAEFEATVVQSVSLLVGVPLFLGDPAAALWAEAQHGPLHFGTCEDAVAAAEYLVEGGVVDVACRVVEDFGAVDGVYRKAAQFFAQMAPGVEVPVVAVVNEALGGDFPAGDLVSAAGVVFDDEALAAQGGGPDGLEVLQLEAAGTNGLYADAAGDFGGGVVSSAEDVAEAVVYLARAGYVTGVVIPVDGGERLGGRKG